MHRLLLSTLILILYAAVSAWCVHSLFDRWGLMENADRFDFESMLSHEAHRPWAYRVLMPALVNSTYDLLPEPAKQAVAAVSVRPRMGYDPESHLYHVTSQTLQKYYAVPVEQLTEKVRVKYHIAYAYVFASLLGALLLLRALTRFFFPGQDFLGDFGPLGFGILLPLTFRGGGYLYDFPEILFLCAAFYAAARQSPFLALVLPLAVLNKESNVLLIPVLAAGHAPFRGAPWKRNAIFVLSAVAAVTAFSAVRIGASGNPGSGAEYHLPTNLRFWLDPMTYVSWNAVIAPYSPFVPFPSGSNPVLIAMVVGFCALGWRSKPRTVRRWLLGAAVLCVPLMLVFGSSDEVRNLSLCFVPMYLAACHTLASLYGLEARGGEPGHLGS